MGTMNIYHVWLLHALFWLGAIVSLFGLFLVIMPSRIAAINLRVNKWISTDRFFHNLDQPRYNESLFYKRHRLWGILILLGTAYILYMFQFRTNVDDLARSLPIVADFHANSWIYQSLVIFLTGVNAVILVLSLIIIIRPSLLKRVETFFNQWVQTGQSLNQLDRQYQIPDNILPGNVRLFGFLVLAGGIYIALSAGVLILK